MSSEVEAVALLTVEGGKTSSVLHAHNSDFFLLISGGGKTMAIPTALLSLRVNLSKTFSFPLTLEVPADFVVVFAVALLSVAFVVSVFVVVCSAMMVIVVVPAVLGVAGAFADAVIMSDGAA